MNLANLNSQQPQRPKGKRVKLPKRLVTTRECKDSDEDTTSSSEESTSDEEDGPDTPDKDGGKTAGTTGVPTMVSSGGILPKVELLFDD